MAYRQSLMKYAEKYGVSRASRKYNKSRSYIYFWKARWDSRNPWSGQSRRPHSHPNQHTEATKTDPGHAPQEPPPRRGGTVAPAAVARLHPPPGEPVPSQEKAGAVPTQREENGLQAKALPADDLSWPAGPDRCESGAPQVYRGPGTPPIPVYRHRRVHTSALPGCLPGAVHLFLRGFSEKVVQVVCPPRNAREMCPDS